MVRDVDPYTLTPLPGEPGQPDFAWADVQAGAVAFMNNGERFYMNANWRNYELNNNSFNNLKPSNIARIHYTTSTIERAAMIYLPYNEATVQDDGNLSSTALRSPYGVRYGDYLIVLNDGSSDFTAQLPPGPGRAQDLIRRDYYDLGTKVDVAAGQTAIFWLVADETE